MPHQITTTEGGQHRLLQLQESPFRGPAEGFLKNVANRLGDLCEEAGMLPAEQCVFRRQQSTTQTILVICRLQELEMGELHW